jgi:hypothetical protein
VEQFFYLLPVTGQNNLALTSPVNLPSRAGTLILVNSGYSPHVYWLTLHDEIGEKLCDSG